VTPQFPNMSTIVLHLYYPQLTLGRGLTRGMTTDELDHLTARLDDARTQIEEATPRRTDAGRLRDEMRWSIDLVALLTRDARARLEHDGTIGSVPEGERRAFASELDPLIEQYRERWLARNRPGGLDDSVAWLHNLHAAYESGHPDPEWGGWHVRT
jgi:hypothetical protein